MAQIQATGHAAAAQPNEPLRVTLDAYLELLDTARYEVIDGELIAMTPQHKSSSKLAHRLLFSINDAIKGKSLGEVMNDSAFALDVEQDSEWVRGSLIPDVAFMSAERLRQDAEQFPNSGAYRVAPELVIEVVLPTDKFSDVLRKVSRYSGYGVSVIWVVDPGNKAVHVYSPEQPDGRVLGDGDTLAADRILPGWSMTVETLFAAPEG